LLLYSTFNSPPAPATYIKSPGVGVSTVRRVGVHWIIFCATGWRTLYRLLHAVRRLLLFGVLNVQHAPCLYVRRVGVHWIIFCATGWRTKYTARRVSHYVHRAPSLTIRCAPCLYVRRVGVAMITTTTIF
jgi:ribosomal protein L36